jgi:archaellum biogenesis protein FlaJ (TadC family)
MTSNYSLGDSTKKDILEREAITTANNLKKKYTDSINTITSQLDIYNGLLVNLQNVDELNRTYKIENNQLFKQFKEITHDVLTNERKTYYEDQQNDILNNYYYYILWTIYIIIVLCIVLFSLIYPSQSSWKVKISILIVFILLPYISTWLLGKIIYIIYWLFNLLPKNVYK